MYRIQSVFLSLMLVMPSHAAIQCTAQEWDSVTVKIENDKSAKVDFVITPRLKIAEILALPTNGVTYPYIIANMSFPEHSCVSKSEDSTILECYTLPPLNTEIIFPREKLSRTIDNAQLRITRNSVNSIHGQTAFHNVTWFLHDQLTGKSIEETRNLECVDTEAKMLDDIPKCPAGKMWVCTDSCNNKGCGCKVIF